MKEVGNDHLINQCRKLALRQKNKVESFYQQNPHKMSEDSDSAVDYKKETTFDNNDDHM